MLAAVTSAMADPDAFVARVKYFYSPGGGRPRPARYQGRRVIDRHTGRAPHSDGQYLGRIWFFRDITKETRLAREEGVARTFASRPPSTT